MTDFIEIKDIYGMSHILNKNHIIHIGYPRSELIECKSVIDYGTGFLECIYMKETIDELNEKYKFVKVSV
ncbi:MAG: hypothetical protein KKD48_05260 [Nanoarchaeota archaeon]|nr:hypothetical protein [Nanoarchaeota archaeon]